MPNDPWFTDADVEKAGRAMADAELEDYMEDYRHYDKRARAALSAIPDPRTELYKLQEAYSALESERNKLSRSVDAARADGFDAAKIAISAETARRWPEAHDLLDWIDELKPEPRP